MEQAQVLNDAPASPTAEPIDATRFPSKVKRPRKRINKALAGVLAATTKQTWDEIAPKVGAKNGNSLKQGMFDSKVTKRICQSEPGSPVRVSLVAQVVTEASELLRKELNGELVDQVAALRARPVTFKALSSKGQGRAATVKQIVESWRGLNGNPDQVSITFGVNRLESSDEPLAIDSKVVPNSAE